MIKTVKRLAYLAAAGRPDHELSVTHLYGPASQRQGPVRA
jgi:hypothetical protein